jgi:hypothetical protein
VWCTIVRNTSYRCGCDGRPAEVDTFSWMIGGWHGAAWEIVAETVTDGYEERLANDRSDGTAGHLTRHREELPTSSSYTQTEIFWSNSSVNRGTLFPAIRAMAEPL